MSANGWQWKGSCRRPSREVTEMLPGFDEHFGLDCLDRRSVAGLLIDPGELVDGFPFRFLIAQPGGDLAMVPGACFLSEPQERQILECLDELLARRDLRRIHG